MSNHRHIRKFDQGRRTPQEFHREFGFPPDAKCAGCRGAPHVRAITLVAFDDARQHGMIPDLSFGAMNARIVMGDPKSSQYQAILSTVLPIMDNGKPKQFLRASTAYSCTRCRPTFEKTLAKLPSWMIVEINEGPDPTNRIVAQV